MTDQTLLVVEDDPGLQSQLQWSFDDYKVHVADDRDAATSFVKKSRPQVVTLDLGLPPDPGGVSEGFNTLKEILAIEPKTKVIVITGNDQVDNAVKAIGLGAYDFYQKPIEPEVLSLVVERAFKLSLLESENRKLSRLHVTQPLDGVVSASPEMHEICRMVEKLAPSDISVLIWGESGTGKELIARALHKLSDRADKPFVAVNSAAIPENLLESELFGHEKGAFTGADKQLIGRFEMADGGTFFLDEIGDIPMQLQPKLLRFLQERVIERVGGRKEIPVDVRLVCATHRNLQELIKEGSFREDLYYRINEMTINLPPLRKRTGDPVVLARAFLDRYAGQMKRPVTGFTEEALVAIAKYEWPGNIRELENKVKRAVVLCHGNTIETEDLELNVEGVVPKRKSLKQVREEAERVAISQALSEAEGNVSRAAEMLDVTRPTLYSLLSKLELKV